MTTPTAFDSLKSGKGRLYLMPKEKRVAEWNRLKQHDWATKHHVPKYEGYIKINQDVINELQTALDSQGGDFRYNLKVCEQLGDDGEFKQFNLDYWIPTKPKRQPVIEDKGFDLDDDDLPF